MLRTLAKLLQVLNSETAPGQISLGIVLAMVMGLTPLLAPHNLIVLLLLLVLRVNLSAFLLGLAGFSSLAYVLDPLLHAIGMSILQAEQLQGVWTALYNTTPGRLEHFNNSIVMGGLVVSLLMFIPLLLILNRLITHYRAHVPGWFKDNRLVTAFKASSFYSVYESVSRVVPP